MHTFVSRPLVFKLQQEVSTFNVIYVSWSSKKTAPEKNFLKLQNQNFKNVSFYQ